MAIEFLLQLYGPFVWGKAKWPDLSVSVEEFRRWPNLIFVQSNLVKIRRKSELAKSPQGCLKFKDGSSVGQLVVAGIGGVLRDHEANIKLVFSKSVGMADLNLAELLAVRKALILFSASRWAQTHKLLIESDSYNVVKWVNDPSSTPRRLKNHIAQFECLKLHIHDWPIAYTLRDANEISDGLVKSGVHLTQSLIARS
ncbi:hypothetical protein PTKIN_Ptkin16aG0517100 [Pterospermum kingtungense]